MVRSPGSYLITLVRAQPTDRMIYENRACLTSARVYARVHVQLNLILENLTKPSGAIANCAYFDQLRKRAVFPSMPNAQMPQDIFLLKED